MAKRTLQETKDFLTSKGYIVTIPANAVSVKVMGFDGKYFKAKNKAANTITHELNLTGVLSWNLKDRDGYHNFFAKH
jgi:hypothetical protein